MRPLNSLSTEMRPLNSLSTGFQRLLGTLMIRSRLRWMTMESLVEAANFGLQQLAFLAIKPQMGLNY
jgi:hypothetical protein